MTDKYPNLPGTSVTINDGNVLLDIAPVGPVVGVLGTAKQGPSKFESKLYSSSTALSRFGSEGTLARAIVEAFQGGADNVSAYRVLATRGKIEHIGDSAGSAGYTITTVVEGSNALERYSILYDNAEDILKVYNATTGELLYSNDSTNPVDLGTVTITGEKAVGNLVGSIGEQTKVEDDETDQTFTVPDDTAMDTIVMNDAGTLNLGRLQFNASTNPYFVQCLKSDGSVLQERTLTAVDIASKTLTLDSDLTALSFPEGANHKIRFISKIRPIRIDNILTDRLYITAASGVQKLLVTPGSDFNGLNKVVNSLGSTADLTVDEVEPAKMNMYEAVEDAFMALEASPIDVLLVPGVYLDDPALDGETTGATALPTQLMDSTATGTIQDVVGTTLAGRADRFELTFDDADERTTAKTALATAGRGACWIVFRSPQGSAFGDNHTAGELVRTARILSWEDGSAATKLIVHFDRNVSFSLSGVGGTVVAARTPAFAVYDTDLLFYHRSVEVDGALVHQWYTSKIDLDGYTYNEVNFAYRIARFCHEATENENSTIAVIGVNPPTNHFNPASIARWIGKSPVYDTETGDVITNGSGLLGFKFIAGKKYSVNGAQFDPGFKATESGELDDATLVLDNNNFEIDLGKFLSIVPTWPIFQNNADTTGLGYINSGASIYAGLLSAIAPWSAATMKKVGIGNTSRVRLAQKLAKRHLNSLTGARYTVFDQKGTDVIVVDAPSAALPNSDFTRNMSIRLVSQVITKVREVGREFLGEPLTPIRKGALETRLLKELSDMQKASNSAILSFSATVSQSRIDQVRGTARVKLSLRIVNELRKINVDIALQA